MALGLLSAAFEFELVLRSVVSYVNNSRAYRYLLSSELACFSVLLLFPSKRSNP